MTVALDLLTSNDLSISDASDSFRRRDKGATLNEELSAFELALKVQSGTCSLISSNNYLQYLR